MLDQQPVGVALDDGEDIVQFVRDDRRDVTRWIEFRFMRVTRTVFKRRSQFFID